ncbi:MAG: CBS domain-containing protein [Thermodesulfobacteriota bacterium]
MLVSEIMSADIKTVSEDALLKDVAMEMTRQGVGCLPVVDAGGKLAGIISESDFVGALRNVPFSRETGHVLFGQWTDGEGIVSSCREAAEMKLKDFMNSHVVTVSPDDTVEEAVTKMLKNRVRRMPVVKDGKLVAMFSRNDLLKIFK